MSEQPYIKTIDDFLGDPEAEKSLLGSIFINGDAYEDASMYIDSPATFSLLRHGTIWQAMTRIKARNEPLDPITIASELDNMGKLDDIGGRGYLMELSIFEGTSVYVTVYAQLVERLYRRRQLAQTSDAIKKLAFATELEIGDVQTKAEDALSKVWSQNGHHFGAWAHEVMSDLYDEFERMLELDKSVPGVPTGITPLDNLMLGFEPSQLSIFAGRPGMGKTSTFVSILLNRCSEGEFVLFFSSEMSRVQVIRRLWSMVSGVPVRLLKTPRKLSAKQRKDVTSAMAIVSDFKLFVDDTPRPTPRHVRSMTKIYKQRYNLKYILVDGIYKMRPNVDLKSQVLNVGSISSDLREIARSFDIHVAATHQLNRAVEQRQDKRPVLSDLRDSGELEQDADKVIFLYRDDQYNAASEAPNQIDFIVAKHRDGSTGIANAYFDKALMQVKNGSIVRFDLSDE